MGFLLRPRKFTRGLKRKPMALIKKLRKKKRECPANEKPDVVKTLLRNMVIVPEMTGSMVGVYNGKTFNQVEINPEMIVTTWASSPSPTSQSITEGPVSVPPIRQDLFLSSKPSFPYILCVSFEIK